MKKLLLVSMALAAPAFAGTSSVAPASSSSPTLCEWFVGGTFGQLNNVGTNLSSSEVTSIVNGNLLPAGGTLAKASLDNPDFNVYTLQVGRSLTNANGWDLAGYLEVGWLDGSMDFSGSGLLSDLVTPWSASERVNVDVVPVTLNFKVEHAIYGPVDGYVTAGAGYAWSKISGFGSDTRDGGFYGQASAGLLYNVCERFQLFGGARWSYLSHVNLGDTGIELNNNKIGWEVGARYVF